jgi:Acetyltransferases
MIQTKIKNLLMKPVEMADVETIYNYIYEMAVYEKLEDQVELTVEILANSFFVEKSAEGFIVQLSGKNIGYVILCKTFSTFLGRSGMYIEDLFIEESYRGRGFGKAIFIELARLAQKRNQKRIDWQCLDWNVNSLAFYKSLGAQVQKQWVPLRLEGDELDKLAEQ